MRDSMVFYRSFYEAIKGLPDEEFAEAVRAILSYALDGEEQDPEGIAGIIFTMAKPQIDTNNKRYKDGFRGGRPRKSDGSEANTTEKTSGYENEKPVVSNKKTSGYENEKPNVNDNDNENDNENVNVNENDNENDNVNVNENENHKGRKAPVVYFPNDPKLDQSFHDYIDMRKSIKKPLTDRGIQLAITKLKKLSSHDDIMDNDTAIKILEQSVFHSWQGLFPLKEEGPPGNNRTVFDDWRDA